MSCIQTGLSARLDEALLLYVEQTGYEPAITLPVELEYMVAFSTWLARFDRDLYAAATGAKGLAKAPIWLAVASYVEMRAHVVADVRADTGVDIDNADLSPRDRIDTVMAAVAREGDVCKSMSEHEQRLVFEIEL